MSGKRVVVQSINSKDGHICVDIFQVPDGSFGFEEYRRDIEDPSGWFAIGCYGSQRFDCAEAVFEAACSAIPWLDQATREQP